MRPKPCLLLAVSLLLSGVFPIRAEGAGFRCTDLFNPTSSSKNRLVKRLLDLGFDKSVAQRLAKNESQLHPYLQPNSTALPPILLPTVVDSARGFRRTFKPANMRGSSGQAVVLYRGLKKSLIEGPMRFDSEYFKTDDFKSVGNVVWVTRDFEEARAYAVRNRSSDDNYVLELHVPEFLYYQRNENEGFLIPDQFKDLRNYLKGIHVISESRASRKTEDDDFFNWYKNLKIEFVSYEKLPTELRNTTE